MATTTPNLGLTKPEVTDKLVDSLYGFNGNADLLDEIIGKLSDLNTAQRDSLVAAINEALTSAGSGDMTKAVYDPQGKAQDIFAYADAKYNKPSGGIPKTDLASAVQTSLGKADSALQSVPSTYRTASAQDTIDSGKQARITASGILKGDGAGGVSAAVKGTDYAGPSVSVSATLTAAGWNADTKTQTVNVAGVTATANGSLRIAQSATDDQFTAWGAAQPRVTAQADGSITVKLAGTVPTIDIPVEVLIV